MDPVTKETQWWEKTSKKRCRDTLVTWRQWNPKNRPSRNLSWFPSGCRELGGQHFSQLWTGILVLSPKKELLRQQSAIEARPRAAETALLAQLELAQFLSYNKATAFYYSKIMLLLRVFFIARQEWDCSIRSLLWKRRDLRNHTEESGEGAFEVNTKGENQNE